MKEFKRPFFILVDTRKDMLHRKIFKVSEQEREFCRLLGNEIFCNKTFQPNNLHAGLSDHKGPRVISFRSIFFFHLALLRSVEFFYKWDSRVVESEMHRKRQK